MIRQKKAEGLNDVKKCFAKRVRMNAEDLEANGFSLIDHILRDIFA